LETAEDEEALYDELAEAARGLHGIAYNVYEDSPKDGAGNGAAILGVLI
jgi:hypothetical protein